MICYIMRHGTTVWNEKGITQGRSNNRLSRAGVELAEIAAEQNKNTYFGVILSSPLMRTMQTANIMNKFHNVKIIKNELLTEIDQGYFTGKKRSRLSDFEAKKRSERSKDFGMESYSQAFERAKEFANYLKELKYENVLIVTHNCIATFLYGILTNKAVDFNDYHSCKGFDNAEIRKIEL